MDKKDNEGTRSDEVGVRDEGQGTMGEELVASDSENLTPNLPNPSSLTPQEAPIIDKYHGLTRSSSDLSANACIKKVKKKRKRRYWVSLLIRLAVAGAIFGLTFLVSSFSDNFSNFISNTMGFSLF